MQLAATANALDAASAALKTSVTNVYTNVIRGVLSTTLQIVFDSVAKFTAAAYCGFVGVAYRQLKVTLCATFQDAFTMLGAGVVRDALDRRH